MNLDVARGSMRMISNMGREGFLDGIGVSRGDFDRLVGNDPWMASDRNRMTTCFHTVINASVDAMGLPRFNLSAEFVAAGIAVFVSPVNCHAACVFASNGGPAEEMGRMASISPSTPEQLFALLVQLYGDQDRTSCRALFEKNTTLALDKAKLMVSGSGAGNKASRN